MSRTFPCVVQWSTLAPFLQDILAKKEITLLPYGSAIASQRSEDVEGLLLSDHVLNVDSSVLDLFPNLKVISCHGVGYNHVDVAEATRRGIRVGNTPDCLNDCTADMGFALLLSSARNVVEGDRRSKDPNVTTMDKNWYGVKVTGATLGIVGMGRIGTRVAERAKGFRMRVLYHNRNRKDPSQECGAEYCPNIEDLLNQSDFVMAVLPSTPQTVGMFSARLFSMMKPTATFINIGRGNLVNHDDLLNALQSGTIRAAALDVTEPEPLPREHPLLKLPNIIITPHVGSATKETRVAMFELAWKNLEIGLKGVDLPHGVN